LKLQIALDRLSYEECLETAAQVHEYVDIIEVGTGVIKEYGLEIVSELKKNYPDILLLADVKICDAGKSESEKSFEYLSDIITVMAFADINTIKNCQEVSEMKGKNLVVDLLNIKDFTILDELQNIGVKNVSLHIGKDQNNIDIEYIHNQLKNYDFNIFVAGGINLKNIDGYLRLNPEVVIVGSGITKAENKSEAAKTLKKFITEYSM
jgi:3-hexulose-6-phosphate synthase